MISLGIDIGGGSVKTAVVREDQVIATARSASYCRPTADELSRAIREAVAGLGSGGGFEAIGLCAPGLLDKARRRIVRSVNVPGLEGVELEDLVADFRVRGQECPEARKLTILTDAHATACDIYHCFALNARLLVLVIGTGVGAAVIDETGPLHVDGDSPGHFGQLDVSLEFHGTAPIGPDGGAGSLEAYVGSEALRRAYGDDLTDLTSRIGPDDPPILALARAIRIAHAIYRPQHVVLAGGLGIRMAPLLEPLRRHVDANLTNIARTNWTLQTGKHDHHAAIGAAREALRAAGSEA